MASDEPAIVSRRTLGGTTTKKRATIQPSDAGFAIINDGEIIRDGFTSRGHAAMWAARQKIYQGKHAPRRKPEIPPELEDESIKKLRLLAAMSGKSYWRFLAEAKSGVYGELYLLGKKTLGLKYGAWKRGMAARQVQAK
jgi:hypothetical protein